MARPLPEPPLLVITERHLAGARGLEAAVASAIAGGVRWVSLREKDLARAEQAALLARLARPGLTLFVHGDVALAAELGLAGVHLPAGSDVAAARRRLGAGALIGLSTHSVAEATAEHHADYVTLSPIFLSASKPGYGPALGLAALREACRRAPCPVLALGGVAAESIPDVAAAGAAGMAMMGGIMQAPEPAAAVRRCLEALRSSRCG
jgi:thiamine-phosphate pyrophosphorylase